MQVNYNAGQASLVLFIFTFHLALINICPCFMSKMLA
uniref:Uncharacterized protein n=1 Tax=Anguilla anguilla TaxID=7936 RepID=A0A0E9PH20_ANGAN